MNLFDIVIPVGPNDIDIINNQIQYTKTNIIGYRNIFLVSYRKDLLIDNCITIPETIFPFSINTVSQIHGQNSRNGWYLQQLLKLYAGIVIPDILEKYLVIDSDTFFLKPTIFIENNKCLYNYGTEYHKPYFEHMSRLDNKLKKKIDDKSGICHHMIFETKYINEMIDKIENTHNDKFYNIFLKMVSSDMILSSGASEYEIYFNYMLEYHLSEIEIRSLKWINSSSIITDSDYDYISIHWYRR
jgi:hypothetical protein